MGMRGWVLRPREVGRDERPRVGGKAAHLARLEDSGWPVPPWLVITTEAFEAALGGGLAPRIEARLAAAGEQGSDEAWAEAAREVQSWIRELPWPEELAAELVEKGKDAFPAGVHLAVRSSAVDEDGRGESFAGLHDSYLYRRTPEEVAEAVRGVWASAFNERALAYRRTRGLSLRSISVAVVVQEMVDAAVSGVLFTANPVTGDVHEMTLSALYGAGEGLVSAGLDADTWQIQKRDLELAAEIAEKEEQLLFDEAAGFGLCRQPVPADRRGEPCLTEEQVKEAGRAGLAVEKLFRCPQDVELSFDGEGQLFLLQARAVTTAEEVGPAAGNPLLWDNSNIIESYSGVTTPMTFSFIRRAYAIVYHCFAEVMGIEEEKVKANRQVFENMLGLFRGQVYYNLRNWYRVVRLFPGYEFNKEFMESMMGVSEPIEEGEAEAAGAARRYLVELPALLRLATRVCRRFFRIRSIVGRFQEHFRRRYESWRRLDFDAMAPHEHLALYREMEDELLWKWQAPIVNDFYVMVFYGTLSRLCSSWCGDESGSLQNDLLCGEGGIESTEPTRALMRMAVRLREQPDLARRVLETPPEELNGLVRSDTAFAELAGTVESYLDLYGFRGMHELKLEEPSVAEKPEFLFQMLRNYVAAEDPSLLDLEAAQARERRVRREAEARAKAALSGPLGPLRRLVFKRVLTAARRGVKNRENLRFARTRIYGLFRQLLLALGDQLAAEGILDQRDDVFYLALEEVWDYVQGTAVSTDLKGLAALRRREFDAYRQEEDAFPDDRFETFGLPYHRNLYRARRAAMEEAADGEMRGTPCCPGTVRGKVKVIRSPSDDMSLDGEILVASRTDPGWVPLFPSASGLLVERGSILSHSAIVAREMGLPAIVGIPGLLSRLETGQEVEMDGAKGTVELC